MTELLAIPAWNTAPKTLDDWTVALSTPDHPAAVLRDGDETWIEVTALRLRGFVELQGKHVEAINFELTDPDIEPAERAVAAAALALGWEVHPDEPEEDDPEED